VTVTENDLLAAEFERHRAHLRAVAYRMLGSLTEADDAVQEAWFRLARADSERVSNLGGWLTTVVARIALDMLRSRRARREDSLDEPVVTIDTGADPEQEALLAESVGLALLVVLDTLSPAERLAFVLHDMFGVPFGEIATIVERTPEAARQLASRARRRVRGAAPAADADLARQREVVDAFLAAARAGDFERLVAVLDPEVVFRFEGGRIGPPSRPAVVGADDVARQVLARGTPFAAHARPAVVNGGAGVVVAPGATPIAVVSFAIAGDRIAEIDVLADPERLRRIVPPLRR
jgi:RNA polymerase sigma factor (sigma-70 family)